MSLLRFSIGSSAAAHEASAVAGFVERREVAVNVTIEKVDAADSEARSELVRPLGEPSVAGNFAVTPRYLGFGLKDALGVDGGIACQLYWDWLVIDHLAVPERWRGHGFGRRLVEAAEREACEIGCTGAWVSTYSFQSPGFYQHMGFEIFGRLPGYPGDGERLFLSKLFG